MEKTTKAKTKRDPLLDIAEDVGVEVGNLMFKRIKEKNVEEPDRPVVAVFILKMLLDIELEYIQNKYGEEALESSLSLLGKIGVMGKV